MRQKSGAAKTPSEQIVRDIRRATRKHYSAEDKIRIVLMDFAANTALPNCAVARGSQKVSITAGRRNS